MNDRITAGAMALMVSMAAGTHIVRAWPAPNRHRAPKPVLRDVLDEASLDELLGPWPEPVYGAVTAQEWRDCTPCGRVTAGSRNKDGWLCGECLTPAVETGATA